MKGKTKALLESAAKKKSEALVYDDEKGTKEAAKYVRLLRQSGDIDVDLESLREFLLGVLQPWHEEACARRDEHQASVLVQTEDGTLCVQFKGQYKKIPAVRACELQAEIGAVLGLEGKELAEAFDRLFEERVTLSLRKEIARDPEQLDQVVRALTKAAGDQFGEWFETELTLAPTEEFTQSRVLGFKDRARLGIEQVVTLSEKKAA